MGVVTIACPSCQNNVDVETNSDALLTNLCGGCFHDLKDEVKVKNLQFQLEAIETLLEDDEDFEPSELFSMQRHANQLKQAINRYKH